MAVALVVTVSAASQLTWLFLNAIERLSIAKREAVRVGRFARPPRSDVRTVVVLGDSRLTVGLMPAVFDAATNGRTFTVNLALPSHDARRSYYQLKDFVDAYGAPDYAIVELRVEPGESGQHALGAGLMELLDYAQSDPSAYQSVITWWLPARAARRGLPPVGNWIALRRERRAETARMVDERGVFWWEGRHFALGQGFIDPQAQPDHPPLSSFDPSLKPGIARLMTYAGSIGTQVLLVTTPWIEGNVGRLPARPEDISDLLSTYANVHQTGNGWQIKFYPSSDFFNRGHVNELGATRYSREIAGEFLSVYGGDNVRSRR